MLLRIYFLISRVFSVGLKTIEVFRSMYIDSILKFSARELEETEQYFDFIRISMKGGGYGH